MTLLLGLVIGFVLLLQGLVQCNTLYDIFPGLTQCYGFQYIGGHQLQTSGDVCDLPQLIGTGPYRIPRWYFNTGRTRCELFYYSGCCGNGNNFPSPDACQVLCEVNPCELTRDSGTGSRQLQRYFFNPQSQMCEEFNYYGSGGNRNNFLTVDECRSTCNESPNPCAIGLPMTDGSGGPLRCGGFSQQSMSNACPANYYCHIGAGVTTTVCCPSSGQSPCEQMRSEGQGNDNLMRFYFDYNSNNCQQFSYRGMKGNENNFVSLEDCERTCFVNPCAVGKPYEQGGTVLQCSPANLNACPPGFYCHVGAGQDTTLCCRTQGSRCAQPLSQGMGGAVLPRFYFDNEARMCKPFVYKGERGNANNFLSPQHCQAVCPVFQNPCLFGQPSVDGSGQRSLCRMDGECPEGFYCHSGVNSEHTVCCPSGGQRCQLPLLKGEGDAEMPRFFFDKVQLTCRKFMYRGAKGNDNNFRTKEQCEEHCHTFNDPCARGAALRNNEGEILFCDQSLTCDSQGYYCHVGAAPSSVVCCPTMGDACSLRPSEGVGESALRRFFFDASTLTCNSFVYKGTKGNDNNFVSLKMCEHACPVFRNPCLTGEVLQSPAGQPQRCDNDGQCATGYFCHVGANAETTVCCRSESVGERCTLLPEEGRGSSQINRFYFNTSTRSCDRFVYRGLMGNENNFITREACAAACPALMNVCPSVSEVTGLQPSCVSPSVCPRGHWCHHGIDDDTTVCCPGDPAPCSYPENPGEGQHQIPRYYYNAASKSCLRFIYRGLQGNPNNFITLQQCEKACPTWINVCPRGEPILDKNDRPEHCNEEMRPCPPNYFCHVGAQTESTMCCPGEADPCKLQVTKGAGSTLLPRWHYDSSARRCRSFLFKGAKGNANNFLSRNDCEHACPVWTNPCSTGEPFLDPSGIPQACLDSARSCPSGYWCHIGSSVDTSVCCPDTGNACEFSMSLGEGRASLSRWYYDADVRECKFFHYKGTMGNSNNFLNRQQCEDTCPVFRNPCDGPLVGSSVRYCSQQNPSCPDTYWCHFGNNEENTLCCPNAGNACEMPRERGSGSSQLPRWFYNFRSRVCEKFVYTGMGGNQNNFFSQSLCETSCPTWVNPCNTGTPVMGTSGKPASCASSGLCPPDYWCHKGIDRETTVCCPSDGNPCTLKRHMGTGRGQVNRWYFDPVSRTCLEFMYTGAGGNSNNFNTRSACEATCPVWLNPCPSGRPMMGINNRPLQCSRGVSCPASYWCHMGVDEDSTVCCPNAVDPCSQLLMTGNGDFQLDRWYYDDDTRTCKEFVYSGRGGNQNNFLTSLECHARCPVWQNPCSTGMPILGIDNKPVQCSKSGECPSSHWCHFGLDDESTICCPNAANPCRQPLAPGTGNGQVPRWFYDQDQRACKPFAYSGIGGNQNNFRSEEECLNWCPVWINPCPSGSPLMDQQAQKPVYCTLTEVCPASHWCHHGAGPEATACCPNPSPTPCTLPAESGVGGLQLERWFFDPNTRTCTRFSYAGTKGNQNNFLSPADCEKVCPVYANPCGFGQPLIGSSGKPVACTRTRTCRDDHFCHFGLTPETTVCCPRQGDACAMLPVPGTGLSSGNSRWFFEKQSRSCQKFVYTGIGGNENNFITMEECERACPVSRNPCPFGSPIEHQGIVLRCGTHNPCPPTAWCHEGAYEDTTVCCPNAADDPCALPLSEGDGSHSLQRWYYDAGKKTCLPFSYRGLKGNQNNFPSKALCSRDCPEWTNPCSTGQPALDEAGMSTLFCGESRKCPLGFWCHFGKSRDQTVCCPAKGNACLQPMEQGSGGAQLTRWFFDRTTRRCRQFNYAGSLGNENNFVTLADCEADCPVFRSPCPGPTRLDERGTPLLCDQESRTCPLGSWCHMGASVATTVCCMEASDDVCRLPKNAGTGGDQLGRWYFEYSTSQCLPMTYTGQKGNENNFATEAACEKKCPVLQNPCIVDVPLVGSDGQYLTCDSAGACPSSAFCHIGALNNYCCPKVGTDACQQPILMGQGKFGLARWAYDASTRQCVPFNYMGLLGNQNNFLDKKDCERACGVDPNPCPEGSLPANLPNGGRVQCSANAQTCPANYWCHIGLTPDNTICCSGSADSPCFDPALIEGEGSSSIPRWSFMVDSRTCGQFAYRGQRGSQNNFVSQQACEEACPVFQNPCASGEPQMGPNGRPVSCQTSTGCADGYWCHLGASSDTTVCCPGELRDACVGMAPQQGEGSFSVTRFYYDRVTQSCREFVYRGIRGNQNNFLTRKDCQDACPVWMNPCPTEVASPTYCSAAGPACPQGQWCHVGASVNSTVCCPGSSGNGCELRVAVGQGTATLQRYYFNGDSKQCVAFNYRGMKGNENNFLSVQDCQVQCPVAPNPCSSPPLLDPNGRPQSCSRLSPQDSCPRGYWCHVGQGDDTTVCCSGSGDPCQLPVMPGEGDSSLPRWYFDGVSRSCQQFTYNGLRGNQNNFLSQEMCSRSCRDFDNPCVGPSPALSPTGQVIFCSKNNRECPVNFWCHIGATPRSTLCCPGATNPCSVPLAPGTGTDSLSRYYYNADLGSCVPFTYNGKLGNQNNFLTPDECAETCPAELCALSVDQGGCTRFERRYAYNRELGRCIDFQYGGCGGNLNNFKTLSDCTSTCSGTFRL